MFTFFFTEASPFSQWYPCSFTVDDKPFRCAEQYMMWEKARLFGDAETADLILVSQLPGEQKALGRKVKNFDEAKWKREREKIVHKGNHAKFTQNPDLSAQLFATKGTTLVEASPFDRIWGIGLTADDPRAQDQKQWRGENLLGKVLTKLRDELAAR